MASIVWRKVLGSRATPILFLLCMGGLAVFAFHPDAGVLEKSDKVIADGGLIVSVLAILSVLFLGGTEIALELHDQTAMFWLAHPIARWRYVLGKLLGACIVGWTMLILLGGALAIMFASRGIVPNGSYFLTLAVGVLRVLILSALLTCLSTGLGYMQSTFIGGVVCLIGFATYALPLYAYLMGVSLASGMFWLVYFLIPNWDHFGFGLEIGIVSTPLLYSLMLVLYSVAYAAFFAILAVLAFQFRDVN
ncbi:MAG: ABC transporter permease [Phycisphaerae bacterium]|nr:ABC transporter permease [Phycisphaerae bacterium]